MEDRKRFVDTAKITEGSKALDAGTGDGFFALWIARRIGICGLVIAIDISSEYVRKAHQLFKKESVSDYTHVIRSDLRWIPVRRNALDVAASYNFVSSINVPSALAEIFSQIKGILKKDGRIVAVDYNPKPRSKEENLFFRRFVLYRRVYKALGKSLHVTFFLPDEIRSMLEKLGFRTRIDAIERDTWMPKKTVDREIRDLIQEINKANMSKRAKTIHAKKLTDFSREIGEKGIKYPPAVLIVAEP